MTTTWQKYFTFFLVICLGWLTVTETLFASNIEGIQKYQHNLRLTSEHKQKIAADIDRFNSADNLWDVLRQEFILPHYEDNPYVQEQINWIINHQDFLTRSATRAAPYLYYILQQVRKRHLPAELALLPMFESAYNPFAYSSAGAAGIWQMMPRTASGFGIKQNWWYDGRRDVVASTKAALDYLVYLGNFFEGNWLLSIGAYDAGEGTILTSIKKNVNIGAYTDFWSLPLPRETREYVPRLLALAAIIAHPEKYPLNFPFVRNAPYLAEVDVGRQINLRNAAELAGLSHKHLLQLNPGFNHSATDPTGPYRLVLPIENVEQFVENLGHLPQTQHIRWIHYKTKAGDTIISVAKRFKVTPATIKKTNLVYNNKLKRGTNLIIPKTVKGSAKPSLDAEDTAEAFVASKTQPSESATTTEAPPLNETAALQAGDTIYLVREGDDIEKIAQHFYTTPETIEAANHLAHHQILAVGKKLLIPTHFAEYRQYRIAPGDTVYMVRRGDTIEKIAARFHLSVSEIRVANLLTNNILQEGDRLVIPTHFQAPQPTA